MTISTNVIYGSVYLGLGLDVCPPVQEDLDGLEMALPGTTVECGEPTLIEIKVSKDTQSPKRRHSILI